MYTNKNGSAPAAISNRHITTVPNQSVIEILPDDKHNSKPYGIITEREQVFAGRLLNDKSCAHILYYYIALNQTGYQFALSPTAIFNRYGIKEKAYRNGVKRLKEVGYLVPKSEECNILYFYRIPERYISADIFDGLPDTDGASTAFGVDEDIQAEQVEEPSTLYGTDGLPDTDGASTAFGVDEDIQAEQVEEPSTLYGTDGLPDTDGASTAFGVDGLPDIGERNIINNINNNTDNILYIEDDNIINDTDSDSMKETKIYLTTALDTDKIKSVREKYKDMYNTWYEKISEDTADIILDQYLSQNPETDLQKRMGDKYGRIICGWDEERHEPIIAYSFTGGLLPYVQHNTEGVPFGYFAEQTDVDEWESNDGDIPF